MLFYIINRVYIILFVYLLIYSLIVNYSKPKTYVYRDVAELYTNIEHRDDPIIEDWKDNYFRHIFLGFNFLLIIFLIIISILRKIIYDILSFGYDINNDSNDKNILLKTWIKVGENNYHIEVFPNDIIILNVYNSEENYEFKKIRYEGNIYYLKMNNKGLKDQMAWTEFKYPFINELFINLLNILKIIFSIEFFAFILTKLQINDEITYKYLVHLIELGHRPIYYINIFLHFGDLHKIISNIIIYFYLVIGILISLSIAKRALYGGFRHKSLVYGSFIFSFIFCIVNLFMMIICLSIFICTILVIVCSVVLYIDFMDDQIYGIKIIISFFIYLILFILIIIVFIKSIRTSKYLYHIFEENCLLHLNQTRFEQKFIINNITTNNDTNIALEINNNFPEKIFYNLSAVTKTLEDYSEAKFYTQLSKEDYLNKSQKIKYAFYKIRTLYEKGIKGIIFYFIIIGGITFIFIILVFSTLIKDDKYYKAYKDYLKGIDYNLDSFSSAALPKNCRTPYFTLFWISIDKFEIKVLASYIVFLGLYLAVEILSYLILKNIIKIFDIRKGIFYNIIIIINYLFYIIFMIYVPLFLYLFIYSVVVTSTSPIQVKSWYKYDTFNDWAKKVEKDWNEKKNLPITNCIFIFIVFFLNVELTNIKNLLYHYINKDYGDDNINNENEENEKTGSMLVNNKNYNVKVKFKETIYLKYINKYSNNTLNNNADNNTSLIFKKIDIEGISNIYFKLGQNSITEQISNCLLDYPLFDTTYNKLDSIFWKIYILFFINLPLSKFLVYDEYTYFNTIVFSVIQPKNIKKVLFYDAFMIFGGFQTAKYIAHLLSITILYLIIIFLYKLYRIYFGGFKKKLFCLIIYLNIAIIIQYILVILCNLTSEVLVVFCIISYFKGFKYLNDVMMEIKLFVEPILSIPIGILDILVLIDAIKLYRYFNSIRNDFYKINQKNQNENEQNETDLDYFSYISLNNDYQCLYEYRNNEAFPNVTKCFYYIPNEMINKGKHEYQESKENY